MVIATEADAIAVVAKLHYAGSPGERRRHWLGLPIAAPVFGTLTEVRKVLPHFGRQPFAMTSVNGDEVGVNPFMDMVYRVNSIPVGVVSKNYRLVDHHQVLQVVHDVLVQSHVNVDEVSVRGDWTANGERARFSLILPPEAQFKLDLNHDEAMRFRIEIFNSVEGSCRLMAVAGWLRLVCWNGLIIGTALMQLRQQHRQQLQVEELGRLLRESLDAVAADTETVAGWLGTSIHMSEIAAWVDEDVRKAWGVKAAVRTLGLIATGRDVRVVGELKKRKPSQIDYRLAGSVPGMDGPVEHLFGVSQALTWLAGQRSDLAEDLQWRGKVPDLMGKLEARL